MQFSHSGGSPGMIIFRPDIRNILLSKLPQENLLFNKRILSIKDIENGTRIVCSDGSEYEGHVSELLAPILRSSQYLEGFEGEGSFASIG